jgi:hypothetical protein
MPQVYFGDTLRIIAALALFAVPAAAQSAQQPKVLSTSAAREYLWLVLQARRTKVYEAELVVPVLRSLPLRRQQLTRFANGRKKILRTS